MVRDLLESITGYPGLFAACATSGILFPMPEDIALLYAGVQIDAGTFSWAPVMAVSCLGVLIRDIIVYWLGRLIGDVMLSWTWLLRLIGEGKIERARRLVENHGTASVLAGRFMIAMRAPVFLVAGASGVGFRKFVAVDILGILITVPGVVVLGYWVGAPVLEWGLLFMRSSRWFLGLLVVIALGWLAYTAAKRGQGEA